MIKPLPLSPPDCIFLGRNATTIQFLFRFPNKLDGAKLRSSYEDVSKVFFPLRSQVEFLEGYPHFVMQEKPFDAIVEQTVDHVPDITQSKIGSQFIDEVDSIPGEALTKIRITHTPQGSLLGVSISHAIVDGYSYFYFLNSWAAHCRGEQFVPPNHDRMKLIPSGPKSRLTPNLEALEETCGFAYGPVRKPFPAAESRWQGMVFTREQLAEMATKAAVPGLSSNDLLTAHLFSQFVPKWNDPTDQVKVACVVDARRLRLDLGSTYFGNAVRGAVTSMSCGELKRAPLGQVASAIRKQVSSITTENVNSAWQTMHDLWNSGGMDAISHLHVSHPANGFLVTNMSRLNIKTIDFGNGSPDFVATPVATRRVAIVLAHPDGVSVQVSQP